MSIKMTNGWTMTTNELRLYWAERAMSNLHGFTPMNVPLVSEVGRVHGYVVCYGNFDQVEQKRKSDYEKTSRDYKKFSSLIWC